MIEVPINIRLYSEEQRDELQFGGNYIKNNFSNLCPAEISLPFLNEFLEQSINKIEKINFEAQQIPENFPKYQLSFIYDAKDFTELHSIQRQLKIVKNAIYKRFTEQNLHLTIVVLNKIICSIEKYETENQD